MAIGFDTVNKIILLDSLTVSASQIWTAWVDWVVLSDNTKYLPAFSQIGGVAPIALYLTLENAWRVRPVEADGTTVITGNLLTAESDHPVIATLGSWQNLVVMSAPIAAQAIQTGSGLSVSEQKQLRELYQIRGLDPTIPREVTTAQDKAGDIILDITGDGVTTSTTTRQP